MTQHTHTTLEEHIEQELARGEEQDEFVDQVFTDAQCPNCRIVFEDDDSMLRHICGRGDIKEY